jgi:hypothetical protein
MVFKCRGIRSPVRVEFDYEADPVSLTTLFDGNEDATRADL